MKNATYIMLAPGQLKEGVDESRLLEASETFQRNFVSKQPGIVRRILLRAKNGGYADLVFFDGTLWRDDEMIAAGLGGKTGKRMGHMAMSDTIPALAGLDIGKRVFLHINNSNPALREDSPERRAAREAGWIVPADGMEIDL